MLKVKLVPLAIIVLFCSLCVLTMRQGSAQTPQTVTLCENGMAGNYPCSNVDLATFMPFTDMSGGSAPANDVWGWTDDTSGREFALLGRANGTEFIEITDPENPIHLGNLPTHTYDSYWRDIKTHSDHAIIGSQAGGHGMQIFDLTQLLSVTSPITFSASAHYDGFSYSHNVVSNEESDFVYGVGSDTCSGGLHMVDLFDPLNPIDAGCYSYGGYTHDAQCVIYNGPDAGYRGIEICFNSNEDMLTIVDVTNKRNPTELSRISYLQSEYVHQGWLTEDMSYFLINDESDEKVLGVNTTTFIMDVRDLNNPTLIGTYVSSTPAADHNLYIKDGFVYQANYRAGLRILDASDVANGNLTEVGYFDIYPSDDNADWNGAWSVYPYFDSGTVIVSSIETGLFILRPNLPMPVISIPPASTPEPTPYSCGNVTEIPTGECEALVAFYNSTNGNGWRDTNITTLTTNVRAGWLQTDSPCSWHGVVCSNGSVTELHKSRNNLSEVIPAEIGNLTNLRVVDMSVNRLASIPVEIGNLTNLRGLDMHDNKLTSIPIEIGSLTNLRGLYLDYNQLMTIPAEIGDLTGLLALSLTYNQLTSVPAEISTLSNLISLNLYNNQLTTLPAATLDLTSLGGLSFDEGICVIADPEDVEAWGDSIGITHPSSCSAIPTSITLNSAQNEAKTAPMNVICFVLFLIGTCGTHAVIRKR